MFISEAEYINYLTTITFVVTFFLLFFFIALFVNVRLRSKRKVDILEAIIRTEENERNRIAQDLHDEINPLISSVKLEIEAITANYTEQDKKPELTAIAGRLNHVIQSVRQLSKSMSSNAIAKFGLIHSIEDFGHGISRNAGINFVFFHEELPDTISPFAQSTIYRIVQELIVNSIKHSTCTEINLSLSYEPDELFMEYTDNGSSTDPSRPETTGIGLQNIESRVNILHGKYTKPSDYSSGSTYTFTFQKKHLA